MNIVLLGCPGAGKGTLAGGLETSGYTVLTTGAMYRREAELKTEFGLRAKEYWGNGNLCPDEMTNELMRNTLDSIYGDDIVFDGYPRTAVQAEFLDSITKVHLAIDLVVPDEEAVRRLLRRAKIENRPDDTPEVIEQRLKVYHSNKSSLVNYYKESGRYRPLSGVGTPDETLTLVKVFLTSRS